MLFISLNQNTDIHCIPSSFIPLPFDDKTKTDEAELENMGFDATSYNYEDGYSGYAAHTIGHRKITINNNTTGDDSNDIRFVDNGTNSYYDDTNSLSFGNISISETDSGNFYGVHTESIGMDSGIGETISESDSNSRTLIVISVRGSVTPLDWA